jgi:hypothetical protein
MKANTMFRRLLKVTALVAVAFIMQACDGFPFGLEMRRPFGENAKADTTISEDLQLSGFGNEEWQSGDDDYIP